MLFVKTRPTYERDGYRHLFESKPCKISFEKILTLVDLTAGLPNAISILSEEKILAETMKVPLVWIEILRTPDIEGPAYKNKPMRKKALVKKVPVDFCFELSTTDEDGQKNREFYIKFSFVNYSNMLSKNETDIRILRLLVTTAQVDGVFGKDFLHISTLLTNPRQIIDHIFSKEI